MLLYQRLRAQLSSFRALRCVESRPRRNSQKKLSNLQRDDAAFSIVFLPRVPHKQSARSICLPISTANVGTTARGYSSRAAEELESPFIGDDDASFLQHMVTLGSSASQVSDLAALEALLAMPNIQITMKTIGAKVIISALEQRQQWALLPALISIPELRLLAQDHNLGIGEQLFAALLRGQFTFASRRGGAAPDVFRTLDLASKCNALHGPAVIQAVRSGYELLGLESPAHINILLDIGPTDATSLRRLARRVDDEEGDENEALGPVGTATGRLTGGMFVRQIAHARKTQSVYAVLPAVLAALPRVHDRDPNGLQRVLGAVCGRDVYTVSEVQGLARALGTVPNVRVWSQVIANAIHKSGPTDAVAVVQHVYHNVADGYVGYHTLHQVIAALVGRDYLAVPSRESVQLAWKLFELHRIKGGDRALEERQEQPGSLMPLISAFMADINIPEREVAVDIICRYTEAKKIFGAGSDRFTQAGAMARLAALRHTSHMDALEAALAEPGGPLTMTDFINIFSTTVRFRFADATTAPFEVLPFAIAFARARNFSLDQYCTLTYIRSIATSVIRLHADMGMGLLPVASIGVSNMCLPEQHMHQALAAIRQAEIFYHDPEHNITMDQGITTALHFAYSVHGGVPDDCARLRSVALSTSTMVGLSPYQTAINLLAGGHTYEEVKEAWDMLLRQGLTQSVDVRCRYAGKLLGLRYCHAAIEFARRHIPDDPSEPEIVRFAARLLLTTEDTRFRSTAREVLPITLNDPRTREATNKLVAHRRNLGLKGQNFVSAI